MSYVNLYTQTEYSLLNSSIRIKDLPKAAKEMGYEALGIADNNLSGVVKFYKECHNVGIKPIIGLRLELQSDYVLLYAKNNIGYVNLLKIRTIKGTKLKISIDDIKEYLHDLVVIIPGDSNNLFFLSQQAQYHFVLQDKSGLQAYIYYLLFEHQDLNIVIYCDYFLFSNNLLIPFAFG